MRKLIYYCDRCKKEAKQIYDVGDSIELCGNCHKSFKKWWKRKGYAPDLEDNHYALY